jgi:hypothetical protein
MQLKIYKFKIATLILTVMICLFAGHYCFSQSTKSILDRRSTQVIIVPDLSTLKEMKDHLSDNLDNRLILDQIGGEFARRKYHVKDLSELLRLSRENNFLTPQGSKESFDIFIKNAPPEIFIRSNIQNRNNNGNYQLAISLKAINRYTGELIATSPFMVSSVRKQLNLARSVQEALTRESKFDQFLYEIDNFILQAKSIGHIVYVTTDMESGIGISLESPLKKGKKSVFETISDFYKSSTDITKISDDGLTSNSYKSVILLKREQGATTSQFGNDLQEVLSQLLIESSIDWINIKVNIDSRRVFILFEQKD